MLEEQNNLQLSDLTLTHPIYESLLFGPLDEQVEYYYNSYD